MSGKYTFPGHSTKKHCKKSKVKSVSCKAESYNVSGGTYVPVILAHVNLQTDIASHVKLPSYAKEVKSIKKNVSIKQCEVLKHPASRNKAKIFVKGTIHKNIQYVESCNGYLRDYSVDVPFTCIDEVYLSHADRQLDSQKSTLTHEYKYTSKKKHGADESKFGSYTYENFNEPIECVLKSADIFEIDLTKDYDKIGRFINLTERMDVNLWFMLVQNQERYEHCDGDHNIPCLKDQEKEALEEDAPFRKNQQKSLLELIQERIDQLKL
ncbi:hypothetical protein D3H55_04585 [Bacillus salacetis]|uniref:DUF3794 domain-containing protein n=1 Tax=Bacillus salacetis TaxID=2315464 RepID=A0A3A1R429_9BACI|nr:hypothetical protein [Bacillus salacetis]RIW37319.1 hypothetical protein D3H55_04585 [Bacillus salacetis]